MVSMRRAWTGLLCARVTALCAGLLLVPAASAQYQIYWYTFDGGGGTSTGGAYSLSGTIGQPDAGYLAGGQFEVLGGYWVIAAAPCDYSPCDANCDGSINGFDIDPFVGLLTGSGTPCSSCAGDVNGDGSVDGFDIDPFVDALSGGSC
ncbi:MAG: hypothetical protein CHACPFDD_02819 [Phycisphaerae bacterium]|nr:hypothetical protein [Phycisphaerae bacterium]